jgi:hypothetical protein|nr:MAG TPA: hypothetical protein [Caudoviricetes sp.]
MSNSLSRFSPTNVWDSLPDGSLGLALVPSGGAYTVEATSSAGGANVPKLGESDSAWSEQATSKGKWLYRRYNGMLLLKPDGPYSQTPPLNQGNNVVFNIPAPYRDGIQTTVAPILKNIGNELSHDGSYIKVDPGGNVTLNAKAATPYVVPTVLIPTGL